MADRTAISMQTEESKLGYTCTCGQWWAAGGWAAAHWHIDLIHHCTECGRTNVINDGVVVGERK